MRTKVPLLVRSKRFELLLMLVHYSDCMTLRVRLRLRVEQRMVRSRVHVFEENVWLPGERFEVYPQAGSQLSVRDKGI